MLKDINNAIVDVVKTSPETVGEDVDNVVTQMGVEKLFKLDVLTLVKINLSNETFSPGTNTSPWVLDALFKSLRTRGFQKIRAIECDASHGLKFALRAMRPTKIGAVLKRYGVEFLLTENLPRDARGLPEILEEAQLINVPVIHTHDIAVLSCATKNLFGLLPIYRHEYHDILSEKLLELTQNIKTFTLVDGTVGLDGGTPRVGRLRKLDLILAGWDPLKIDLIVSYIVGFSPQKVPLLDLALKKRVLNPAYVEVRGDFQSKDLPQYSFDLDSTSSLLHKYLLFLEKKPLVKKLLYWPLFYKRYSTGLNDISITTFLIRAYLAINYTLRKRSLLKGEWRDYYVDDNSSL